MEYKADLERAMIADYVKPSASRRYRTAAYTLTALSSIALGALAMALFYHWNELQMSEKRLETQHVQEVIRLTDVLLSKQETNAANVEKLLTSFQHKLQSIEAKLQPKADTTFESNLTYEETKDNNQKGFRTEGSTVSPNEVKIDVATSIDTKSASGSDETKQTAAAPSRDDKEKSSESFQWSWSFPQSAWLKLSPYGINYGTASENVVESNEQE